MRKEKQVIGIIIGIIIIIGVLLFIFYPTKIIEPSENNQTNDSVSIALFDRTTIEATILNLSTEMFVINTVTNTNGTLYGNFATIIINKIINHTRYDPLDKLGFDPLIVNDIINVALFECSHESSENNNISVGDKILINITAGEGINNLWFEECI